MSHIIETERYLECTICKEKQLIPWDGRVWVSRADKIEQVNKAFKEKHRNCK